jgi:hypothetical protein
MSEAGLPPVVADALRAAGYPHDAIDEDRAREWALLIAAYESPDGHRHALVPAALEVFARYGGLRLDPPAAGDGPLPPSGCHIDPRRELHSVRTLATFGAALGTELTPLGSELTPRDQTGILAIDTLGRVFVVDHTAEWYLGDTFEDALAGLLLGRQPARVAEDGRW